MNKEEKKQGDKKENWKDKLPDKKIKKFEFKFDFSLKNILLWLFIGFIAVNFFLALRGPVPEGDKNLPQVLQDIREDKVEQVEVEGETLYVEYKDDKLFTSRKEPQETFTDVLDNAGINPTEVNYKVRDQSMAKTWGTILEILLPVILTGAIFFFIFRQAKGSQDSIFSFGKSSAKLFAKGKQDITFDDVGDIKEAKKEMQEVVDFLKHPKKYEKVGARTPKGVLLVGPSGTGKTLLARAVAGEAKVPFFSIAGSEFMEMLVGVGASRARDLFKNAKKAAPSIIFIDEIDAIGRMRGAGVSGGHGEREQTLNQILVEMDGFEPHDNVIVIAATNRGDLLDPALMRPGRFDRRVVLELPDLEGRKKIIKIHKKGKPFSDDVEWDRVAKRTVGFSGADLENMLNEAAIWAARHDRKEIIPDDLEEAAMKVKLGPEKKRLQSEHERKMTAYHEAGHAVVTHLLEHMDPVHRVSIVSRGKALGYTLIPPERDRQHETRSHMLEIITSLLGGRAAETMIFDDLTSGAASDIERATQIVRRMVIKLGMSDLGPIHFGKIYDKTEWGEAYMKPSEISDEMRSKVDEQINKIIDQCYKNAEKILKDNKKKLDKIVDVLLEKETIEQDEFEKLMNNEKASSN